jgi:hypothetical protein
MCYLSRYTHQNIAYFGKLGNITKRGGIGSSYSRLYSKAKQNILCAIYLVSEYWLATKIKQIKVLP